MPPVLIVRGLRLLWHPDVRWLVFMPLLINASLFFGLGMAAVSMLDDWLNQMIASLPSWLEWLATLAWFLFAGLAAVVFAFGFTILAHLIGSPFYGLIAERVLNLPSDLVEVAEKPENPEPALSIAWHSLLRQLHFLKYVLPRSMGIGLLAFVVGFVPLLSFLAPVIVTAWTGWALALQYLDYPAEAQNVSFDRLRRGMSHRRMQAMGLGLSALLLSAVPVLNLILVPATVVAGTLLWRQEFRSDFA